MKLRGPKGRQREWGSPPHQLRGLGRCKLPHRSPGKFEKWCNLKPQKSLQTHVIMRTPYQGQNGNPATEVLVVARSVNVNLLHNPSEDIPCTHDT